MANRLRLLPFRPLLLTALLLAGASAHAEGVDPAKASPVQREQAQSRFVKGRQLFGQKRYEQALEEFRASHDIVASPNARFYAGRCLREMGRLVAAYSELGRAMIEAREQTREDPRYARTADSAEAERRSIAPKLGFVNLTIENATEETQLRVGGEEIKRSGWSEAIPVSPGSSEVELMTPGREPLKKGISLSPGETKAMAVNANDAPLLVAAAPPPPPPAPPPPEPNNKKLLRTLSYVSGGVAVVGLGTFATFGILANGKFNDLKSACNNGPCPPSRQSDIDAGRRDQTIANVGLVVGGVAAAAAVTLFIASSPKKPSTTSARVMVSPGYVGLGGAF